MPTQLVVNADDFGMTAGINRAVAELHAAGVLSSATLMARGAAFEEAAEIALENPALGVGCHVVLVDGWPSSEVGSIASLLKSNGSFRTSLWEFAAAVHSRFIWPSHIERETAAQIAALQDAGLAVTHVDTHKHTHMFPRVSDAVMRGAAQRGVFAIRNPFEPAWSRTLSPASLLRRGQLAMLSSLERQFHELAHRHGMASTQGCLGVMATGTLNASVLEQILNALPGGGQHELVCHPGYHDAALQQAGTRLLQSRDTEREALLRVLPGFAGRLELATFAAAATA